MPTEGRPRVSIRLPFTAEAIDSASAHTADGVHARGPVGHPTDDRDGEEPELNRLVRPELGPHRPLEDAVDLAVRRWLEQRPAEVDRSLHVAEGKTRREVGDQVGEVADRVGAADVLSLHTPREQRDDGQEEGAAEERVCERPAAGESADTRTYFHVLGDGPSRTEGRAQPPSANQ